MIAKIDPETDKRDYKKMASYIQHILGYNGTGIPSAVTLDEDEVRTLGWISLQLEDVPLRPF